MMQTRNSKRRMKTARQIIADSSFDLREQCLQIPPGLQRQRFIEELKSARGGFTSDTLARLGVRWPPKKGWRSALVNAGAQPEDDIFSEPLLSKLMGERL